MALKKPILSELTARLVCDRVLQALRNEKRSLRRGELARLILVPEAHLAAAFHYGVEHGLLTRIGTLSNTRYDLVLDSQNSGDK